MLRITRVALESALEGARNVHPNEFIGLFRERQHVLEELILAPLAEYGRHHSGFQLYHLAADPSLTASFHSHPGYSARPSHADLRFFSLHFQHHFISCLPYTAKSTRAYDKNGNAIPFEIIE